jgi:hypothetical protein
MKTASAVAPHGVVIGAAAEVRVDMPSSNGVMPRKRRFIRRSHERQDARGRWSAQLHKELDLETLDVLYRTRAEQLLAQASQSQHTARTTVLELLGRNPDILNELTGYAEDEAKAEVTESYLRAGKLLELAKRPRNGLASFAWGALRDLHGRPFERGQLPSVIRAAQPEIAENFTEAMRRETLRVLEDELDRQISSATSPLIPRVHRERALSNKSKTGRDCRQPSG